MKRKTCFMMMLVLAATMPVRAGTIMLHDGKRIDGEIKFTIDGALSITPEGGGSATTHQLKDVKTAVFTGKLPKAVEDNAKKQTAEWAVRDVGSAQKPAVMGATEKRITVRDFSNGVRRKRYGGDSIAFIGQRLEGNGEIVARLIMPETNQRMRAGLMVRETLQSEARYVSVIRGADGGECAMQIREERTDMPEVVGETQKPIIGPAWLKLTREGDRYRTFESADGKNWTLLGEKTVPLIDGRGVFIGVFTSGQGAEGVTYIEKLSASGKRSTIAELDQLADAAAGIMTRSGSLIAGQVERVDNKEVRLRRGENDTLSINPAAVARVMYSPLSQQMTEKVDKANVGIMLMDGDFVDGELKDIEGETVRVSSVVFGITQIERRQVAAVVLRPMADDKAPLTVKLADGSVIRAHKLKVEKERLTLEEPRVGEVKVLMKDVVRVDGVK